MYLCILYGFVRGTKLSDESYRVIPHTNILQSEWKKELHPHDPCRIHRSVGICLCSRNWLVLCICCSDGNHSGAFYACDRIWATKRAADDTFHTCKLAVHCDC